MLISTEEKSAAYFPTVSEARAVAIEMHVHVDLPQVLAIKGGAFTVGL